MKSEEAQPPKIDALSLRAIPIYSIFGLWSFGTAAQQLARPLFAAAFGVPVFLVTLIAASNSLAWLVTAPITGFLTDRWGRKPLVVVGNLLRAFTTLGQFFAGNYWQFFALEFIGGIGVSMWATGASIIMADITGEGNRGRADAIRGFSGRLGMIAGPFVAGLLATAFPLRSVFLFNAITKIPIHFITVYLIKETRPDIAARTAGKGSTLFERFGLSMFQSVGILALGVATFSVTLMSFTGVFGVLFPLQAQEAAGMSTQDIGSVMSLTGLIGLAISFPNGFIMDRYGRKKALIPGLLLLALAAYLITQINDYQSVLIMMAVYGLGQQLGMSSSEVLAMDLAPVGRRGAFLGIWQTIRNLGGLLGPLLVGVVAEVFGFSSAFLAIGVLLVLSAVLFIALGPETAGKGKLQRVNPPN